jgi:hypothetical protein
MAVLRWSPWLDHLRSMRIAIGPVTLVSSPSTLLLLLLERRDLTCTTNNPHALRLTGSCVAGVVRVHLAYRCFRELRHSVVALGAGTAQPCMAAEQLTLRARDDAMPRGAGQIGGRCTLQGVEAPAP